MNNIKNNKTLHIAMYPWFAFGHLTPFLHLANKLAEIGHTISFFLPPKAQLKLASLNHHPNLITFIPISLLPVDGLPVGAETTNDVHVTSFSKLVDAIDLTRPTIDSHLSHLKPDIILFDFISWVPELARKHQIKSILFSTSYVVFFAYVYRKPRNLSNNYKYTTVDLISPPPDYPCLDIKLRAHEARILAYASNMQFGTRMTLAENIAISLESCDATVLKSCREIDGAYVDFIAKYVGKPIFLAGPLLRQPQIATDKLDDGLSSWLCGFHIDSSVVYCSLGSECVLAKDQLHELLLGLELTGMPFIAILRPPQGYETIELSLPEGYEQRIKGRGIIQGNWVQQQSILNHPSVGCFITHCGAGSLSEAMLSKCQLVMLPQAGDQFVLAKMVIKELRIGVEIDRGEEDGLFTKEGVRKAVMAVMDRKSKEGGEMRTNHAKVRNLLSREGLEESYIEELVQSLHKLIV